MSFFNMITSVDFSVLDFIQSTMKCAFMDFVMAFFSYIGESGGIWIICALILLCFRKTRATGVMVLCAMAAGYIIGEIGLKNIICRPRPFIIKPDVVPNVIPPLNYSFPSGHSCSSFAAATVLIMRDKRIGIPSLCAAFLIAFSRLYNYVHFPSDVICGVILGIICAIVTIIVFKKTKLDTKLSRDFKYKKVQ